MSDSNNMNQNFIMDLVSALDYLGDIDTYLHECDKESLPCDIKYLKDKVADIKFDLHSIINRLHYDYLTTKVIRIHEYSLSNLHCVLYK